MKRVSQLHKTHIPLLNAGEKRERIIECKLFIKSPPPININGIPKIKSNGDFTFKLIK